MRTQVIAPDTQRALFIKNILVFDEENHNATTVLPFFADGYPGLIFHITPNGQWVQPQNKKMPTGYLYGQTLHPIELQISGTYKIIAFQLYPFVLGIFFNVNSKHLTDECYDLNQLPDWVITESELLSTLNTDKQVEIIQSFLYKIFLEKKEQLDLTIAAALQEILSNRAQLTVKELSQKLHITVRTLERRFISAVGISVKNFIQITKFQQSLEQLTVKDYKKLTDIVYNNGFADQSHFIRVFKAFTGKTPKSFLKK
ncbi:MAG: helix-turn-helix transcriptional regulator [Bacteroidetes bacterium]|nr:MAG: helix-turn-helix transcriptional regulator [Bacteroidota bacterium]